MTEKLGSAPQAAPEVAPADSADKKAETRELNDAEVIDYLNSHPELRAQIVKSTLELVDLSDPIKTEEKSEANKTEEKAETKPEAKKETKQPEKLTKEEADKAEKKLLEEQKELRGGKIDIREGLVDADGYTTIFYEPANKYEPKAEKNEKRDALAETVDQSEFAFINSLENPIKSDEAILKIVDQYLEGNLDPDIVDAEPTPENEETKAAREALEAKLYQKWADNLRTMTQEDIDEGIKNGVFEEGTPFIAFRNEAIRMMDAGQANTPAELYAAFDKRLANVVKDEAKRKDRLYQIFNRYGAPIINSDGMLATSSRYINMETVMPEEPQEVLYLSLNKKNSYDVISQFIDGAEEAGISYNIDGNLNTDKRPDAIAINVSTAELRASVAILKNIAEKNPQILEDRGELSPFVSNVDGWIGVASEPLDLHVDPDEYAENKAAYEEEGVEVSDEQIKSESAHEQSFFEKRARVAEEAILIAAQSWVGRHQGDPVRFKDGRETTVGEYYSDIADDAVKRARLVKFIAANQPKNLILETRANMIIRGRANGIGLENFAIDQRNSQNLALQDNANKLRDIRERRAEALEEDAA